jgi:uncharacterized protein YybS (DUF2232 family)
MTNHEMMRPKIATIGLVTSLVILTLVLPGAQWAYFGWLYTFTPLVSFSILWRFGIFTGSRLLLSGVVPAALILLLQKNFDLLVFSSSLLLSGYVLCISAVRRDSPSLSGLKSCLTLAGFWAVMIVIFSIGAEISIYGKFIQSMDEGINETLSYYRQSGDVSGDALVMIESTLLQMKEIVPRLLPGILGAVILLVTWVTMTIGNMLALRNNQVLPWQNMRLWQLPERLIWLAIATGILALLPVAPFRWVGINVLLLLCLIYTFQGLSILVFFMHKWKVPILFRSFIYVMIVFQTLGTVVLLVLGVAESWFDFRKLKRPDEPHIV